MLLLATPFSGAQLTLIVVISVVCAALLAANVFLLILFFRKRSKRTLSTEDLQNRREELEAELESLRQEQARRGSEAREATDSERGDGAD